MKARLATLLSLTGVLVAGSAAALVNTQVLQTASPTESHGVTLESSAGDASDITLAPPQSVPAAATQAVYQVSDVGSVTLDNAGGALTVVAVTPTAGWTVVANEAQGSGRIAVSLQAGNTVVRFEATLLYGVVSTSVQTADLSVPTVTTGSTGTTNHVGHSPSTTAPAPHDGGHHDDDHTTDTEDRSDDEPEDD